MELNNNKLGLALGIIFVIMHLLWIIAVAGGFAETFLLWWESSHFINTNFTITNFYIGTAILTLIRSFIGGYVIGWFFAWTYNKLLHLK